MSKSIQRRATGYTGTMLSTCNRALAEATSPSSHQGVRVLRGTVIDGKVVVDEPLDEGACVTVVVGEPEEDFELSPELEAELLEAIAEANAGRIIDGQDLLRELRSGA